MVKNKNALVIVFLEFRKLFDMLLNHKILISKIKSIGMIDKFLDIISSFLQVDGNVSESRKFAQTLPVITGIPQSSILAPTLFQAFINDLLKLPFNSTPHACANDTTSFSISGPNLTLLQSQIDPEFTLIQQQ